MDIGDENSLDQLLREQGVPLHLWTGNSKKVKHLLEELRKKETVLVVENDQIIRDTNAVVLEIFFNHPTMGWLELLIEKTVFHDGEEVPGKNASLSEKFAPSKESVNAAFARAVHEELGFYEQNPKSFTFLKTEINESKGNKGYIGLTSRRHLVFGQYIMSKKNFDPRGYSETTDEKTIFFRWYPCSGPTKNPA